MQAAYKLSREFDHAASGVPKEPNKSFRIPECEAVWSELRSRQKQMKRPSGNWTAFSFKGE
jgi:hypothetical protein